MMGGSLREWLNWAADVTIKATDKATESVEKGVNLVEKGLIEKFNPENSRLFNEKEEKSLSIRSSGAPVPFAEVKQYPAEYAEKFAEGDLLMKQFLSACFQKDIQTCASCIGHDKLDNAYVAIVLPDDPQSDTNNYIRGICNALHQKDNVRLIFDVSDKSKRNTTLTIECNMSNREEVFSTMLASLENPKKEMEFPEIKDIEAVWQVIDKCEHVEGLMIRGTHTSKGVYFEVREDAYYPNPIQVTKKQRKDLNRTLESEYKNIFDKSLRETSRENASPQRENGQVINGNYHLVRDFAGRMYTAGKSEVEKLSQLVPPSAVQSKERIGKPPINDAATKKRSEFEEKQR